MEFKWSEVSKEKKVVEYNESYVPRNDKNSEREDKGVKVTL